MFFGKKRKMQMPDGVRLMHYEGLPGIRQDTACFMDVGEEAVVFATIDKATVTLPLEKIECVDIMPELNFMAKYHNTGATTSKVGVKWYAVITYAAEGGSKYIALWYMEVKAGKVLRDLQKRCAGRRDVVL